MMKSAYEKICVLIDQFNSGHDIYAEIDLSGGVPADAFAGILSDAILDFASLNTKIISDKGECEIHIFGKDGRGRGSIKIIKKD